MHEDEQPIPTSPSPAPDAESFARCANHPEAPAESDCYRCGLFCCGDCLDRLFDDPRRICPACRPKIAIELREELIQQETAVRGMGFLFLYGAFVATLALVGVLVFGDTTVWEVGLLAALAVVQVWVGRGLRRRERRAIGPAALLAAAMLFAFPSGTMVGALILWTLLSDKGRRVVAPGYDEVVRLSPGVRHRRSPAQVAALLFLVLLIVALAVMLFLLTRTAR